jgi:hypothetical protein
MLITGDLVATVKRRQARQSSGGPWVPDVRSLALARPGHAILVSRASGAERNETPISGLPEIGA